MAKKLIQLSAIDIILQADAETIREAYESRLKIDDLLVMRTEAYEKIDQLEQQIETLVGEEGAFIYPPPPVPVAGFNKPLPASRPSRPKAKVEKVVEEPKEEPAEEVVEEPEMTEVVEEAVVETEAAAETTDAEPTEEIVEETEAPETDKS